MSKILLKRLVPGRFDNRTGPGVECSTGNGMSTTEINTAVLKSFDLLPEDEKHQVAKAILLRSLDLRSAPLTDEELVLNAEQVFLGLDRRELSVVRPA